MSKKRSAEPENPFLAQMLFRYVSPTSEACQSVQHQAKKPIAEWEARFYQDTHRALDLLKRGTEREKVNQIVWDEACREQDTIGVRVHQRVLLCDACAAHVVNRHAGKGATTLAMIAAQATGGAFLLVSDRLTENAGIVSNLPGNIEEKDILPKLKREHLLDIHFKQ